MGINELMTKLRIYIMCFYHRDILFRLNEHSVELSMIHMDKSLSVRRKCFNTIIWLVTVMFHYTDYQPQRLLHLYGCHLCFFSFC